MTDPIAVDARGNVLLAFRTGDESDLERLDPQVPLPLALVVARHDGATCLVLDRWRQEWELPGGMIEEGELPRQAALREFAEETGQPEPEFEYAGVATFCLQPDERVEHAAVYVAAMTCRVPFEPNDEIEALTWWSGGAIARLSVLDASIADLVARGWSDHSSTTVAGDVARG